MRIYTPVFSMLFLSIPLLAQGQVAQSLEKLVGGISVRAVQQQIAVQGGVQAYLNRLKPQDLARKAAPVTAAAHTRAVQSVQAVMQHRYNLVGKNVAFTLPQAPQTVLHAAKVQYPLYVMEEALVLAQDSYIVEMPDGDLRIFDPEHPISVQAHTAITESEQRPAQELAQAVGGISARELQQHTAHMPLPEQMPRETKGYASVAAVAQRFSNRTSAHFTLPQSEGKPLIVVQVPLPVYAIDEDAFLAAGSYVVAMPDGDFRVFTPQHPMGAAVTQALADYRTKVQAHFAKRTAVQQQLRQLGMSENEVQAMMQSWDKENPVR